IREAVFLAAIMRHTSMLASVSILRGHDPRDADERPHRARTCGWRMVNAERFRCLLFPRCAVGVSPYMPAWAARRLEQGVSPWQNTIAQANGDIFRYCSVIRTAPRHTFKICSSVLVINRARLPTCDASSMTWRPGPQSHRLLTGSCDCTTRKTRTLVRGAGSF